MIKWFNKFRGVFKVKMKLAHKCLAESPHTTMNNSIGQIVIYNPTKGVPIMNSSPSYDMTPLTTLDMVMDSIQNQPEAWIGDGGGFSGGGASGSYE